MEQTTPPNESVIPEASEPDTLLMRHRLAGLLIISVLIAVGLTVVSMVIYSTSGAAQLDLSRPGYRSVSSQVEKADATERFDASGEVSESVINGFMGQYQEQASSVKAIDAFNGDPLNPELLEFGAN